MISDDPTPMDMVFRRVTNPIHQRSVSPGVTKGRKGTYPELGCIGTPMDACLRNGRKDTYDSIAVERWGDPARVVEGKGTDETHQGI